MILPVILQLLNNTIIEWCLFGLPISRVKLRYQTLGADMNLSPKLFVRVHIEAIQTFD